MKTYSDPAAYWESRLKRHFDLTGVGHALLGPSYNRQMYAVRLRTLNRALQASGVHLQAQHVLEIGCGSGFYTEVCRQQQVASYTGVDITAVSVENLSRHYTEFSFIRADIGAPDFPVRDRFDVILVADVLFHIVDDNRFRQAIANLSSRLYPGGYLILSDILSVATVQTAEHVRLRSYKAYQEALAQHQLAIRHVEPIFALLQPPVSMRNSSFLWQAYGLLWHYGLGRIARWRWCDRLIPVLLEQLDEHFFLPWAGVGTPNSKWLVAAKTDVA